MSEYGRYGCRRTTALLQQEGWRVKHKRVEGIWRQEGSRFHRKQPKRGRLWLVNGSFLRHRPEYPNHVWGVVMERTGDGRSLLTVVDKYRRECLAIAVRHRLTSRDVLELLSELFLLRGYPMYLLSDTARNSLSRRCVSAIASWRAPASGNR